MATFYLLINMNVYTKLALLQSIYASKQKQLNISQYIFFCMNLTKKKPTKFNVGDPIRVYIIFSDTYSILY